MKLKAALIGGIVAIISFGLLAPLVLPSYANAQVPNNVIEFIDKATLRYENKIYRDKNPYDDKYEWRTQENCDSIIEFFDFDKASMRNGVLIRAQSATGDCAKVSETGGVSYSQEANKNITAYKLDADRIFVPVGFKDPGCINNAARAVDDKSNFFKRAPAGDPAFVANKYYQTKGDTLNSKLYVETTGTKGNVYVGSDCSSGTFFDLNIAGAMGPKERTIYGIDASGNVIAGGASDPATSPLAQEPSCEKGGGEWSWLLCPALRIASNFLEFVDREVNDLLTIGPGYYDSPYLKASWSRMRNLAYIILIPVMLVMIISSAMGFEFVSAYTYKKALPRLFVAVIFMSLSFEITKFLIILTNDVGQGILGLVTSSFNGQGKIGLDSLFNPGGGAGLTFTALTVGGAAILPGLIPVLLLYLVSAGLALLVALLALSLRQMLLIAFMVIAPLAILAWIFPGNDKLWKLWWGSFSKLLILFPLIMFLIGSGRAFAALVQASGREDFLGTILKLTAYVGPYFFIPAVFKFAGGVFATITGMANDRSRGVFDRLKKARQKEFGNLGHRIKSDNFYKGGNERNLRGRVNRTLRDATLLQQGGMRPGMWRQKMQLARNMRENVESREMIEKNPLFKMLDNDDIAHALLHGRTDDERRAILIDRAKDQFGGKQNKGTLERAIAGLSTLEREGGEGAVKIAAFRKLTTSSTAWNNDYKKNADGSWDLDENGEKQVVARNASGKMLEDLNKVAGSDRILAASLLGEARENQVRAGRNDTGAGGFADTLMEADKLFRRDEIKGRAYTIEDASYEVTRSVRRGKSAIAAMGEKRQNVEALVPVMIDETAAAMSRGEVEGTRGLASLASTLDALGSTSPQNAEYFSKQLFAQEINQGQIPPEMLKKIQARLKPGQTLTYGAAISALRSDDDFNTMRREYSQAYENQQGAGGNIPNPPEGGFI